MDRTYDAEPEQNQPNDDGQAPVEPEENSTPSANGTEPEAVETVADEAAEDASASTTALRAELEQWKQTADEHYQKMLRVQADYDNFRRRTRQEKEEFTKYASMKLIEGLLPVVDNFERAIAASRDSREFESLSQGVDMIFRQLEQLLQAEGLQPIETVGQPFNPEVHQAVMQVESDEHESGTVVEELQKGYYLKEKVLRPAMVKVSS